MTSTAPAITFRFDDVSVNSDAAKLAAMVLLLRERYPNCHVHFGVSPCVHSGCGERAFPSMLHVESDFREFYRPDRFGLPSRDVLALASGLASHGLVHVDHRLLPRAAQEMSLVLSCALVGTKTVVMPFHKFNDDTLSICREHKLHLVAYHPGMRHLKFHVVTPEFDYYYLHTHDFSDAAELASRLP